MTKTEIFVVCFKSLNCVKYAAMRDGMFVKDDNPTLFHEYFEKEEAVKVVSAIRASGMLDEGIKIRVKALTQAVRDYSWAMMQSLLDAKYASTEKVDEVCSLYKKPGEVKAETKEESAEEAPVETVSEPVEEVKVETEEAPAEEVKPETKKKSSKKKSAETNK